MADRIKDYEVSYVGGGRKANGYEYRALIGLRSGDGTIMGRAYFHRERSTLPATDTSRAGFVACHYLAEDFPRVLDLLRNEDPVYLQYSTTRQMGIISTSLEPVGEGEES